MTNASSMSEFAVACSAPVAGAQTKGVATLAGDVLTWRPGDGNLTGERTAPLHLISGHQRNKPLADSGIGRKVLASLQK